MPQYYFDIVDGEGFVRDDEGVMLASLDDAVREARRALGEMAREAITNRSNGELSIQIRDHVDGPLVLSVTFDSSAAARRE